MKFFVSYSRSVQDAVRAIIAALREQGEEVWWDQDLRAGQDWWATILDNIEQCQVCLFFVSEKSVQSPYCMEELRYALARNRLVLPYVMDGPIAYTLPAEIMKSRIQYETYGGTPEHIRERIRLTCAAVRWDQYKDRYAARPAEPNTGTSDLVDRLDQAISLANEGYFDEAIAGFNDVANNDYNEYGAFCHEWIERINRYRDIAKLADRPAMKPLAKPKWEKFVQQYGDEFDPLDIVGKFVESKKVLSLVPQSALPPAPRKTAREYVQQGDDFYKRGDYEQAIQEYTQAIQINKQFVTAYLNRANCYFAQEAYEQAIADYSEVLKLDPQNLDAYRLRGLSYDMGPQDYDRALADYNEALRLNPHNALVYLNRAIIYNRRQNYHRALADYNEALRINPRYTIAYNNRANTYLSLGEYDKALQDCERALAIGPQEAYFYDTRGDIYFAKGNYDRAIADYEAALRLDPDDVLSADHLKQAREAKLRTGWKTTPKTAEDYLEQGKSHAAHEYDLKIADYTEAIRLNPRLTEAYLRRAGNYNAKEEYDNALADYDQALQLEPDNFIAFNGRGLIYASLTQYTQAIADYSEAIRLAPQFADVYYNRGISYAARGEYEQAIADYSDAIRINPQFANAYYNRGRSYHNAQAYDAAIADYDMALKLDPKHPYAAKNRSRAVEAKGG